MEDMKHVSDRNPLPLSLSLPALSGDFTHCDSNLPSCKMRLCNLHMNKR
jgi:hypothetical protein